MGRFVQYTLSIGERISNTISETAAWNRQWLTEKNCSSQFNRFCTRRNLTRAKTWRHFCKSISNDKIKQDDVINIYHITTRVSNVM